MRDLQGAPRTSPASTFPEREWDARFELAVAWLEAPFPDAESNIEGAPALLVR